jgi:hypothetical protein
MTSVYSGGLVYEYSQEESKYGLGTISGDTYTENDDFQALMQKFADNPAPSGDGGYHSDGTASECPSNSDSWDVTAFTGDELPALPDGAGAGPGLQGEGSQNAGGESTSTAQAGSGSVTAVASNASSGASNTGSASAATSSAAAANVLVTDMGKGPFVCAAVVLVSTLFGASLL